MPNETGNTYIFIKLSVLFIYKRSNKHILLAIFLFITNQVWEGDPKHENIFSYFNKILTKE